MKKRAHAYRVTAAVVGALTLAAVSGSAAALAATSHGDQDIDVSVDIEALEDDGVLALTVSGGSATLTENGSTALERKFTGELPTVTVTDTRDPDTVEAGAYWYVLGSITDFTGDDAQPDISAAESFGWVPELVAGDEGFVSTGDPVDPGEGFEDPELLSLADTSAGVPDGTWSGKADLTLLTGADVAPGAYSAKLTLSLFE